MIKKLQQFRFYASGNSNNNPTSNPIDFFSGDSGVGLNAYMPITHLGIQTLPGVKFYLNANTETPIVVGVTGIYELDMAGTTGIINSIRFDPNSINNISSTPEGYLIVDIIYETEDE